MIVIKTVRDMMIDTIKAKDAAKLLRKIEPYQGQVDDAFISGDISPLKGLAPAVLISYAGLGENISRGFGDKITKADHLWDCFCIGKSNRSDDEAEEDAIKIFEEILDPLFQGIFYENVGGFRLVTRNQIISYDRVVVYHVQYCLYG